MQQWGVHPVFAVTAIFPLLVSVSALLIDEQRVTPGPVLPVTAGGAPGKAAAAAGGGGGEGAAPCLPPGAGAALASRMAQQGRALWGAVRRKDILLPTIFVFLWQVGLGFEMG